jgi:DNA-binding CsgD family transcriptional regulator
MTPQDFTRRAQTPKKLFEGVEPRTIASYERELAKQGNRLREALARAEALRRRNDELLQHEEILRHLLACREDAADRVASLTPREHQILDLVLAGHPSKNIAADLGINQRTVETHRAAIMHKTGSKSLPALARLALAAAWNGPGQPFVQPMSRLALAAA